MGTTDTNTCTDGLILPNCLTLGRNLAILAVSGGTLTAAKETLWAAEVPAGLTLTAPQALTGWSVSALTAPTASSGITLTIGGTAAVTGTIAAGATSYTLTASGSLTAVGPTLLLLEGPGQTDTTLADIAATMVWARA